MKKILLLALLCTLSLRLVAAETADKDAVMMVSYEQGWTDFRGTLAIKNNTDEAITSVSFILYYYDMKGEQLDYKEFDKRINIAPGMTRKVNVDAYEHERNYNYYQSEKCPSGGTSFKVSFELVSYKTAKGTKSVGKGSKNEVAKVADSDEDRIEETVVAMEAAMYESHSGAVYNTHELMDFLNTFRKFFLPLFLIWIIVSFCLTIATPFFAIDFGRSFFGWLLLALLLTPYLALLLLALVGRKENRRPYANSRYYAGNDEVRRDD